MKNKIRLLLEELEKGSDAECKFFKRNGNPVLFRDNPERILGRMDVLEFVVQRLKSILDLEED